MAGWQVPPSSQGTKGPSNERRGVEEEKEGSEGGRGRRRKEGGREEIRAKINENEINYKTV